MQKSITNRQKFMFVLTAAITYAQDRPNHTFPHDARNIL
jgi:hypothetical protein